METQMKRKIKIKTVVFWFLFSILYILTTIIQFLCDWFNIRFGVSFEEILFTIASPLKGSDTSFLDEAVEYVLPAVQTAIGILALLIVVALLLRLIVPELIFKIKKFRLHVNFSVIYKLISLFIVLGMLSDAVNYAVKSLELDDYITKKMSRTTIYEDYYVDPDEATITIGDNPKNIIYIYMESMETTYASEEVGGIQEVNYIPNLTDIAFENISFSNGDQLGGAAVTAGAGWTMGALFSTTTGVPFSFPVDGNSMNDRETFASGITSLGDVLDSFGYNQYFLCGSDGTFAGRKTYFEQHGNYEVLDYYYAQEKGYISDDYYVWWGYEDAILYDIAKKELLQIAEEDAPFNFTMLTVDTHHVDGYICSNCQNTYDNQLGNVLECADNQIYDFVTWCQEQDFYEDTVIVITGDHFRMDSSLVGESTERRVYNCFINSQAELHNDTKNRTFTTLDIFPTTLSAMGFTIEGDRLGLGTNLFSEKQTLAEEMGFDVFDGELRKYSDYYAKEFE